MRVTHSVHMFLDVFRSQHHKHKICCWIILNFFQLSRWFVCNSPPSFDVPFSHVITLVIFKNVADLSPSNNFKFQRELSMFFDFDVIFLLLISFFPITKTSTNWKIVVGMMIARYFSTFFFTPSSLVSWCCLLHKYTPLYRYGFNFDKIPILLKMINNSGKYLIHVFLLFYSNCSWFES